MNQKTYFLTVGVIFLTIALLHLLRVALAWEAVIAERSVPVWPSLVGYVVSALLAYFGFKHGRNS